MAKAHFANEEIEREDGSSNRDEYLDDVLVIDINRVVSNIRATLKSLGSPLSRECCCIYRVPHDICRVNEAAYTPHLVSIGPLHHGKETLKRMEKYKLWSLENFLKRAEESARLHDFVSAIKRLESSIRSCYAETFDDLHSDKFIKMILVDAAFIFEHLFCPKPNDFVSYNIHMRYDIMNDLILLENQLPFFVLEELYNLAFRSNTHSFCERTLHSFSKYNKQLIKSIPEEVKIKHFTDLLRYFLLPISQTHRATEQNDKSNEHIHWLKYFLPHCCRRKIRDEAKRKPNEICDQAKRKPNDRIDHLYSATELHGAGVKFKVSSSNCLFDIKFSNGVLTIPCLKLYDETESYIRNLIALEQCHYPHQTYICNYVSIMDHLINTSKGVDLLVQKKIIVNWLGSQERVATLFNKLGTSIIRKNDNWYNDLCKGLNAHYEVRCHRWKATLRHEYFSTPWRIASIIAAFILLVLTLIQTICAIISM